MAQKGSYRAIYDMQARIEDELEKEIGQTNEDVERAPKELADVAL
jgi:hypothetical protein